MADMPTFSKVNDIIIEIEFKNQTSFASENRINKKYECSFFL